MHDTTSPTVTTVTVQVGKSVTAPTMNATIAMSSAP